ncbi:MAG: hypothetical protein GY715_17225 [Planctomycetes bacterium]|nr:hypothetical protein [Planctomycetota bacterium]
MRRIIARVLTRLRRHRDRRADPVAPPQTTDQPAPAHGLAETLDRAMELGLWEHAARVATTAERLATTWPAVAERLARLRLAEGRPDLALGLINRCEKTTDDLRLLKAVTHVHLDRKDRAHRGLLRWTRAPRAPSVARRMLALLDWEAGDDHAATLALLQDLKRREDPRTLELLLLLATSQHRPEQAATWARRLGRMTALGADTAWGPALRYSLQVTDEWRQTPIADEEVTRLADELLDAEAVIPALVEAQRRHPRTAVAELLYLAIDRALPAFAQPLEAIEGLARLALVRGDVDSARTWMQRGIARNPMSAPLAALRRELDAPAPTPSDTHRPDVLARIGQVGPREQEKAA